MDLIASSTAICSSNKSFIIREPWQFDNSLKATFPYFYPFHGTKSEFALVVEEFRNFLAISRKFIVHKAKKYIYIHIYSEILFQEILWERKRPLAKKYGFLKSVTLFVWRITVTFLPFFLNQCVNRICCDSSYDQSVLINTIEMFL